MSNVLFLTQVLPHPLDSGAKIRAYYVLRQLTQAHDVTVVSFIRDDDSPEALAHLCDLCAAVHTVPMRRTRLRNARALLKAGLTGRSIIIVPDEVPDYTVRSCTPSSWPESTPSLMCTGCRSTLSRCLLWHWRSPISVRE